MSSGKWKKEGQRKIRDSEKGWTTDHELIFIDGLGTHSFSRMSRLDMLKNYLKALNLPGTMKGMDKKYIKTYVKNSIAMEEANPTERRLPTANVDDSLDCD
jgi:hypothetical protein